MSKAFKCDMCNHYSDNDSQWLNLDIYPGNGADHPRDYCPTCRRKVVKFLRLDQEEDCGCSDENT